MNKGIRMKVGIVFWGLTRSLKLTIDSIHKHILNILKKHNIEYEICMHTYEVHTPYNNRLAGEHNIMLDNTEYTLLEPTHLLIDNQDEIKKQIPLTDYRSHSDPWRTNYQTVDNFILAMYSKYRITTYLKENNIIYDRLLFIRPDVMFVNDFDVKWLTLKPNAIYVPDFHKWLRLGNFNDRMALTHYDIGIVYGTMFPYMIEYSKTHPLHSETFQGNTIRNLVKNLNVVFIPFYFNRVRANGSIAKDV